MINCYITRKQFHQYKYGSHVLESICCVSSLLVIKASDNFNDNWRIVDSKAETFLSVHLIHLVAAQDGDQWLGIVNSHVQQKTGKFLVS
jgi:hypothetical protein